VSADSSLHFVTECFDIRALAPAIVPGQISFEISQILEKPEAIDDARDWVMFAQVLRPVLGREQHVSPADQPRQPALFDQVAHRRDLVASAPAKFEALSYLNSRACQILLR
jgi:hypothetical protein